MNPLLIFGGLGILGFALMGLKKKRTSSTFIPFAPDVPTAPRGTPYDPTIPTAPYDPDVGRIASVPGFAIPGRVA